MYAAALKKHHNGNFPGLSAIFVKGFSLLALLISMPVLRLKLVQILPRLGGFNSTLSIQIRSNFNYF